MSRRSEKNGFGNEQTQLLNHDSSSSTGYGASKDDALNDVDIEEMTRFSPIDDGGDSSIVTSVIILTKSCMGAGMLGLPYVFRLCGFFPSLILMFVTSVLGFFSFYFLCEARRARNRSLVSLQINLRDSNPAEQSEPTRYDDVVTHYWGKLGRRLVQLAIFITLFGAGVLYMVVVADNLTSILAHFHIHDIPRWILLSVPMICVAPLTFSRQLSGLRFASTAGLLCLLYLFVVIVLEYLNPDLAVDLSIKNVATNTQRPLLVWSKIDMSFFQGRSAAFFHLPSLSCPWYAIYCVILCLAIPIVVGSFCGQYNAVEVCNDLKQPTPGRTTLVSFLTVLTCTIFYTLLGLIGWLTFGDVTPDDVLLGYSPNTRLVLGELALTFTLLLTIPLFVLPLRQTFQVFFLSAESSQTQVSHQGVVMSFHFPRCSFLQLLLGFFCFF